MDVYTRMYEQSRYNPFLAPDVVGLAWDTLETEWHAYLTQWASDPGVGDCGTGWWQMAEQVSAGFQTLYMDPAQVSTEQYALLTQARLDLNRLQCGQAAELAAASGLTTGMAN